MLDLQVEPNYRYLLSELVLNVLFLFKGNELLNLFPGRKYIRGFDVDNN